VIECEIGKVICRSDMLFSPLVDGAGVGFDWFVFRREGVGCEN